MNGGWRDMVRLKRPTPAENAEIERGIAADPDTWVMSDEEFATAARGREHPSLAAWLDQRATLAVDPAVAARLKAEGPDWEKRANAILRRAVGLD